MFKFQNTLRVETSMLSSLCGLASFLRDFQKNDDAVSVGLGWWPVLFEWLKKDFS